MFIVIIAVSTEYRAIFNKKFIYIKTSITFIFRGSFINQSRRHNRAIGFHTFINCESSNA